MTSKNANNHATALARARERRRALDQARDEQDARIEEATASALVALEGRAVAEQALAAATGGLATAVRALFDEGVGVDRAAALLEVDVAEVRRLARSAGPVAVSVTSGRDHPPAPVAVLPAAAGMGAEAVRRAG